MSYRLCDIATVLTGYHQQDDESDCYMEVKAALGHRNDYLEKSQEALSNHDPRLLNFCKMFTKWRVDSGSVDLNSEHWAILKAIYRVGDIKQVLSSPFPPQFTTFDNIRMWKENEAI